jgi:selenocysteine-specific translation elongation factor
MNLNIGIFGDLELAARLGKKGTTNDIAMFNHASSEGILTYVCPNSPKIQPLLQVLNMIDLPVLVVKDLTKEVGEMIIGIDQMGFQKGFIITDMKDAIKQFIKGTSLENFEMIEEAELWPKLLEIKIDRNDNLLLAPVDNFFTVKGIGTVILSVIKGGKVNLHDKLMVEPLGKEVIVKGIQVNDRDMEDAEAGTRVGLNLKGVESDEMKRGFVICRGDVNKSNEITIKFNKSKFFKQEITSGMQAFVSVGLQAIACKVESVGDTMKLKSSQTIVYRKGQRCIIASQNETLPRIIGSGNVL